MKDYDGMPDVYIRVTEAPRPVLDGLMAALELRGPIRSCARCSPHT